MSRKELYVAIAILTLFAGISIFFAPWKGEFRYGVGWTQKHHQCLPWRLFALDRRRPEALQPGDMVLFEAVGLEPHIEEGEVLVKLVAGLPGDRYRSDEEGFWIEGNHYDAIKFPQLLEDSPAGVVPDGQVLLVGTESTSYDSRYYGPVPAGRIVGTAWPLLAPGWDTNYHARHDPDTKQRLDQLFERRLGDRLLNAADVDGRPTSTSPASRAAPGAR